MAYTKVQKLKCDITISNPYQFKSIIIFDLYVQVICRLVNAGIWQNLFHLHLMNGQPNINRQGGNLQLKFRGRYYFTLLMFEEAKYIFFFPKYSRWFSKVDRESTVAFPVPWKIRHGRQHTVFPSTTALCPYPRVREGIGCRLQTNKQL